MTTPTHENFFLPSIYEISVYHDERLVDNRLIRADSYVRAIPAGWAHARKLSGFGARHYVSIGIRYVGMLV